MTHKKDNPTQRGMCTKRRHCIRNYCIRTYAVWYIYLYTYVCECVLPYAHIFFRNQASNMLIDLLFVPIDRSSPRADMKRQTDCWLIMLSSRSLLVLYLIKYSFSSIIPTYSVQCSSLATLTKHTGQLFFISSYQFLTKSWQRWCVCGYHGGNELEIVLPKCNQTIEQVIYENQFSSESPPVVKYMFSV